MSFNDALRDFKTTFATIPAEAPIGAIDGIDYVTDDLDPQVLADGREAMKAARAGELHTRAWRLQRLRDATPTPEFSTTRKGQEV
ncbi:hypothetical protein [Lysobacter sp. F6437]|uniref:hypothetical protein n=1 Tax=Lysobacter sp. F6437 TaxID=3459296 RepID=UPI00403D8743